MNFDLFKRVWAALTMPVVRAKVGRIALYCLPTPILFYYASTLATPLIVLATLQFINVLTGACYTLIPAGLRTEGLHGLLEVRLGPSLTEKFGRFIEACGAHHYLHWPIMIVMASGFMHIKMGHASWFNYLEAWGGATLLITLDGLMLFASAAALLAGRRDVIRREGR